MGTQAQAEYVVVRTQRNCQCDRSSSTHDLVVFKKPDDNGRSYLETGEVYGHARLAHGTLFL